jgi:uridine phosphorylase
MNYPSSELVLNANGQVYHLGLSPDQIANNVILVGDQDRVGMISSFFDKIDHQSQHREFTCHTGWYKGKHISALSTGIGTDNLDITINELDVLVNVDLVKREDFTKHTSLNLVRIGTCGILQAEIPVHSYLLSSHAYGLDNIAHFYDVKFSEEEENLNAIIDKHLDLPTKIKPYFISANKELLTKMRSEKTFEGITVTSSGFYAPQGRKLRLPLATENLNEKLGDFNFNGLKINNFEMESSALFFLSKALGHKATTICLGIANRPKMEFSKGYTNEMNELIVYVLDRI